MMPIFYRLLNCLAALGVSALLFPGTIDLGGAAWGCLLLTLFYVLLRPVLQALTLPLNLFILGVATPFADALLVWWASAWVPGFSVGYLQAVVIALIISLFYMPYSWYKQKRLMGGGE